jgi:hypothetical protein
VEMEAAGRRGKISSFAREGRGQRRLGGGDWCAPPCFIR